MGVGVRHLSRPPTLQGYERVALREVRPLNKSELNVEVEGALAGTATSDACGGVVTFNLLSATTTPPPAGSDTAASAKTNTITSLEQTGVVLSLPRARYAEVRNLRDMNIVRVRGYLSKHMGEGCSATLGESSTIHFLWVDTIERIDSLAPVPSP